MLASPHYAQNDQAAWTFVEAASFYPKLSTPFPPPLTKEENFEFTPIPAPYPFCGRSSWEQVRDANFWKLLVLFF
jgi:hypothetical protein